MAENQAYLFICFALVWIIIGIVFYLFIILRKTFKTKDLITYIEDIFFWIITGIIIIYSMYKFCDGELRLFMIIGIILGAILYLITISEYVIKISVYIINILKRILYFPLKIVFKFIRRFILRPITIICINLRKNVKKNKKNRGFFIKKEKYNNI